jgi:hypothetical protein
MLLDRLMQRFHTVLGEEVSFATEQDCHNVSGLLKQYFRQMPEPVLTFDLFFNFVLSDCMFHNVNSCLSLFVCVPMINLRHICGY